ncbi:MAG: penicillin amidase [Myxococcaceae bacterium]
MPIKTPLLLAALFALSSCAATRLLGYRLAPDYPDDSATQTLRLPGLSAPVTVVLDAQGVPHVEAKTLSDLARASGFMQGRARFFQMDMMRRLARGRVSEVVGEQPLVSSTTVEYDKVMRGWQIEWRATHDFADLSADDRALITAFADGVNAAAARWKPLEYRLLGIEPEPWQPEDSLAVGLLNIWSITHNYQQEAVRLLLAMSVGVERMNAIYPSEPLAGARTIATQTPPGELPPAVVAELDGLFPMRLAQSPVDESALARATVDVLSLGGASNSWVVSGERTASGKPMVANDPHLSHFLPGLFLQQHLKGPGLDVIGVTVPGLPWVVAGHNQRVAWGVTSTMSDVVDLVLEKEDPSRPGFVLHEGGDCALTSREEVVRVRDGSDFRELKFTLRSTCNGPVYNDLHPELFPPGSPLVAIRWKVEAAEQSLPVLLELARAQSAEHLGKIVSKLPSTWNTWTVGDVDGHIASFVSGAVPVRPNHRGTFPVPGWVGKYEWTDFARGEVMPHSVDPPDGVLAHGNNLMAEPGSPDFQRIQVDSAPPYRLERILGLAKATPKHDAASFSKMLVDTWSLRAKVVAPRLLEMLGDVSTLSPRAREAASLLKHWTFDAKGERPEAAIFFSAYRRAVTAAIEDELPAPAVKFFLAQRYSTNTSDAWFSSAAHVVWDDRRTPQVETGDAVVRAAFEAAVLELHDTLGGEPSTWRWGALHWHRPMHAFGSRSVLDSTVNLDRMEAGGELDSIWKSHFDLGNGKAPFKVVAGPVWRAVMDLADLSHSKWVVDTGASGWPKSPHYGDQYQAWRQGDLMPMLSDLDEVRRGPHGEVTLTP